MPRSDTDYTALPVPVLNESYRIVAEAVGLPARRFRSRAQVVASLEEALDRAIETGLRVSRFPNGAVSAVREPRTRARPVRPLRSIVVGASGHNDNHAVQSIVVDPAAVRPDHTMLALDRRIRVLVDNPKRNGSRAHALFEMYQDGMTGAQYVQAVINAGLPRRVALDSLHWDLRHGYVRLAGRA